MLQRWQFESDCQPISIGRSKLSDIRLASKLVSRNHATLQENSRGWWLEVSGTNGCYVDGYFADGDYLRGNSMLSIGKAGPTLRFLICSESRECDDCSPEVEGKPGASGSYAPGDENDLPQWELVGSTAQSRRSGPSDGVSVSLEELFVDRDTWYGDD